MAVGNSLNILIYVLLLCVGPCRSEILITNPACRLEITRPYEHYKYIKDGDIMIGGVLTVNQLPEFKERSMFLSCFHPSLQKYIYLVEFIFLIKEINDNPALLPNITLGYHIHDSCGDPRRALWSIFKILSGSWEPFPNYSCLRMKNIAGFIGDLESEPTISMAHILGVLGYPQISYGATDHSLSDRAMFPYFYRTVQSDEEEYIALCKVLKYFGWNWIGILKSDDYSGYRDHQLLMKHLSREGICVAFTISVQENLYENVLKRNIIEKSSANVIIICGDVGKSNSQASAIAFDSFKEKTFIFLSKWLNYIDVLQFFVSGLLRGSLVFMPTEISDQFAPRFKKFSKLFNPSEYPEDKLLENIWVEHFSCLPKDKYKIKLVRKCSGRERLTDIDSQLNLNHSASLMFAVELMSVALSHMQESFPIQTFQNSKTYRYQLHRLLKNVSYTRDGSPAVSFNEKSEFIYQYKIVNPQFTDDGSWSWDVVGNYIPWELPNQRLTLIPEKIIWKTSKNTVRNHFSLFAF